jgi:hypothetical protein
MTKLSRTAAAVPAALALLTPSFVCSPATAGPLKKHPVAAGVAAGLVAHHMAKKSAAKGGHGVMARHPKATGVVAGLAVHHALKKK